MVYHQSCYSLDILEVLCHFCERRNKRVIFSEVPDDSDTKYIGRLRFWTFFFETYQ